MSGYVLESDLGFRVWLCVENELLIQLVWKKGQEQTGSGDLVV
jgi:hypothetical protein